MQILFLKFLPSSDVILTFFSYTNSITWFPHIGLANVEDFLNVNIFFKCKLNVNVSINDHSLYLCSMGMLLKTSFLLPHLFCNVDFELNQLIEFQNKTNTENYWVLVNAFWIRLRFVKYRFVRYRFVRYWFRFVIRPWLDTDIPSKHSVYHQDVFKTSSWHVFKTSSRLGAKQYIHGKPIKSGFKL